MHAAEHAFMHSGVRQAMTTMLNRLRQFSGMLAMPGARALQRINVELEHEITLRVAAELDLRASYQELEERVLQRTRELSQANERLTQEIQERERTEQALRYSETLLR